MSAHTWDPERYLTYADERGRPFVELLGRVAAGTPSTVVDLGCGPGNLTALLTQRWPAADVLGLDSSAEMVAKARTGEDGVTYEVADLRNWTPSAPVDVLVSNATLQWVPDHLDVLPGLLAHVAPGGWFAFQVPGNFDEPSHTIRHELEAEEPYAAVLGGIARPASNDAATYLRTLSPLVSSIDAWETTYLHVLAGDGDPDPVFTWISGTSARPALAALDDELRPRFVAELKQRLRAAYPDGTRDGGHGVVMPFRRIFVVVRKGDAA